MTGNEMRRCHLAQRYRLGADRLRQRAAAAQAAPRMNRHSARDLAFKHEALAAGTGLGDGLPGVRAVITADDIPRTRYGNAGVDAMQAEGFTRVQRE